jgi:nitrite reductase (NADH) small subunit
MTVTQARTQVTAAPDAPTTTGGWFRVCRQADITPDRGVAALVGGDQVAVFLLSPAGNDPTVVHAVDNHDPYSGANVIARGLVGSAGDRPIVASPIYKERFDLRDGSCLDGDLHLRAWPVRVVEGWVEVAHPRDGRVGSAGPDSHSVAQHET